MALLASRALDDLSLREIARTVGVSATAVYRHFPDKRALMVAMAGEGRARLAAAQRDARDAAGGGAAHFEATGRAYVRFALANPALFRLIFSHPSPPGAWPAAWCRDDRPAAAAETLGVAAGPLADQATPGLPGSEPDAPALQAWSKAHGLAMLMLDGQVPAAEATIDAVLDATPGAAPPQRRHRRR